jgi:N-acetylglucosaminyl-diphospho-decaprenol L-rhamnosyltransferase
VISIVIVNWNSGQFLENCVRSLLAHAAGCPITIVDNASTDASLNFADKIDAKLSVLHNNRNAGFAAGNNLGWRASEGDSVLFLNPDTECLPESVFRLEKTLQSNPDIWAVGGRLISPSGKSPRNFNVRTFPSVGSVTCEMLFIDEVWPSNPWSHFMRTDSIRQPIDVDQPAAACLMISKTALESIGGFDEAFYPAWFEDVDLCLRIRRSGGRIRYQPNAAFLHHGGYSLEHMSRQDFLETFHANQIRYFAKHYGPKAASRVRRLVLLGLFLRSGLSMLHSPAAGISRAAASRMFRNAARHIMDLGKAGK